MIGLMRQWIVLLLAFPFAVASAVTLTGRTVRVTDGDTIVILSEGNVPHKIRLQGIDAPERGQAYGTKSKDHLSDRVAGRFVVVETDNRDRYGRVIGKVLVGGSESVRMRGTRFRLCGRSCWRVYKSGAEDYKLVSPS